MTDENLKIYAERQFFSNCVAIYIAHRSAQSGKLSVATNIMFEEIDEGAMRREPPLLLSVAEAQRLMDELWNVGLRPSEGSGSAGALAATQAHLKDMQRIVFDLLATEARAVLAAQGGKDA